MMFESLSKKLEFVATSNT